MIITFNELCSELGWPEKLIELFFNLIDFPISNNK